MDFLQDYIPQAFRYYNYYNQYYSPYQAYLGPLLRYLYLSQSYFYRYVFPYLWPAYKLCNKGLKILSPDAPDIATLALLALVLLISLKVLDFLRNMIFSWIRMILKLSVWVLVAAVGLFVWFNGIEQSMEILGWAIGYIAGLEDEGERIGSAKAARRTRDASRISTRGQRRRTRGAGWD